MIDAYFLHLLILVGIYTILAISFQISLGFSGFLNLGHIAFFGIGSYVYAVLALNDFSFGVSLLTAVAFAGGVGFLLSIILQKLKGEYFALVTLVFSFVVSTVFLSWKEVTNGPLGLPGIPRPDIFGLVLESNISFFIFVLVFVILSYIFVHKIYHSSFGKTLEAIRDDELAAKILGKNTQKLKTISFVISTSLAGLAGVLFASYITYIDPLSFTFLTLLPILLIVIIGGLGSLPGTVLATFIIILLPESLRFLGIPSSFLGPVRQILYVVILFIIMYYQPRGFYGKIDLE